jgi:hypothetical protein
MGIAADSLTGTIFLIGDQVKDELASAKASDNLVEIRFFIEKAARLVELILQETRLAQAEIDSGASS